MIDQPPSGELGIDMVLLGGNRPKPKRNYHRGGLGIKREGRRAPTVLPRIASRHFVPLLSLNAYEGYPHERLEPGP